MKTTVDISKAIECELLSWPGVTAWRHRFGGREFRVSNKEIGHLHSDGIADLPFPRKVRDDLVSRGEVKAHHQLPDSGWVSFYFGSEDDIPSVLALFKRNYERLASSTSGDNTVARPDDSARH